MDNKDIIILKNDIIKEIQIDSLGNQVIFEFENIGVMPVPTSPIKYITAGDVLYAIELLKVECVLDMLPPMEFLNKIEKFFE